MGKAEQLLWRALGDPTRRAVLDRLREGPLTTGELCDAFEMTRFGVMKHLSILEEAGLLLVRRQGRQRFNHLNGVPIEQLAQRWMTRFSRADARNLLSLQSHLEKDNTMSKETSLDFHLEQELLLNASPERVWRALTEEVEAWWGYHIGPKDSKISLEGRVGGRFIEEWGDGEGELYATVSYVRKYQKITLEGGMGLAGPGYSKFSYTLEANGEVTQLKLAHSCHGHRDLEVENGYREGWKELLGQNLTAWLHEGKRAE